LFLQGIIGKSPTILETFKLYNASASVDDKLEDINEDEALVDNGGDDDDEDQFALDA